MKLKHAAAAVMIAFCIGLSAFYGIMKWAAHHELDRAHLPRAAFNSVQHAYAAAETYAWLRFSGLSPDTSQSWAIRLGVMNEWFENGWRHIDDDTAEIYKDLANNLAGITASRWLEPCGFTRPRTRLRLIGRLAATDAFLRTSRDKRIPVLPLEPDVTAAIAGYEQDAAEISRRLATRLDEMELPCRKVASKT